MEVVGLVSGGKDSCYAMMKCIQYGHKIVALANLMPVDDSIDELDSYMYQTVGHQIVVSYAECMGLPLFRRRIQGSTRHQHLNYTETAGDEVEDLFILLNEVKHQVPSITAVSSGAIASDYQRLRVESVCSRLGLVSLAFLWKQDQCLLLQEMVMNGIKAITIKVAAMGLNPAKHLAKEIAQLQPQLLQLKEFYGINVCGEGGEYETLTLDCPLFKNAQIVIDDFQVVMHSSDPIAPVGILHPTSFHLEYKKDHTSFSNSDESDSSLMTMGHVFEVKGDGMSTSGLKSLSVDLASDACTFADTKLHFSQTKKDTFSICCWIQEPPGCSDEMQNDLTAVLKKIEIQLHVCGFDWCDVLYIHLYIANMNDFASANETYLNFITEKKCTLGVPSRSTIELPLSEVGLGKAYVEVLVANDQSKKVLHVQSISSWAPSCIGPYSQATMHKEILHMAGQLGLDPPTMLLCSGGALMEMEQALDNSEAVAHCFGCSLASSAILFVIYCSASLTLSERSNVQNTLEGFLRQRQSTPLQNRGMPKEKDPLFIFVLVPNLPKRALVEIKPVLHVPEDMENEAETEDWEHFSAKKSYWGFEHQEWHESCCQKYVIPGKICSLVVSVSNESASKICSESDRSPPVSQCLGTVAQMKRVAMFCIYLLDGILMENNFSWGDLMNLRIYFATSLCLAADMLSFAFAEAFKEFAEMNGRTELSNVPFFNLVPVLGSGRSASTSDLITCELFASKL